MKQLLIICFFSCLALNVVSQTTNEVIERKDYKGIIFSSDFKLRSDDTVSRWTPSAAEIEELENNLGNFLTEKSKTTLINQGNGCPIIHKKLRHYIRQYAGYISDKGDKRIYVNCFWDEDDKTFPLDWKNRLVQVFDGCSYYWQIHYNVTKKTFNGFSVNGSA